MRANSGLPIEWDRVYPDPTHRWRMGLREGDARVFFADRDATGLVRAERARWLATDPKAYTALLPDAESALSETVVLACSLGADIDSAASPIEQLVALGREWEPDFVWLHPDQLGSHRLTGGVVCFPSHWALRDKLGLTMDDVHGPVPDLNAALGPRIETFLKRIPPGSAWVRENVNFSGDRELNHHPSRPTPTIGRDVKADEFWFRFEHQFVFKLPSSGSVLFAIRVETAPLTAALSNPATANRLAAIFSSMSPSVAEYKGVAAARAALIALCSST